MWCYTLFPTILNMSLTAGIVIVLVLLARLSLKKAPKVFSYALWAVVLFRLLCPISFSSGFSLLGIFHSPAVTNGSITYIPADIVHTANPQVDLPLPGISRAINETLPRGDEQTVADPLEAPMAIVTLLWLFGIAAMLIYSIVSVLLLKNRLKSARCAEQNIYEANNLKTPFVLGLFRPGFFIPTGLTAEEKVYIIRHEQMHIRRLDHIIKPFAFLVLSIHWFNPLAWVAFILMGTDMELSCDERVIKEMGGDIKKAYSASLLSLATGKRIINGSPLAFGEGDVKGRIKNVLNYKKPPFWIVITAVIAVTCVSIGLTANPKQKTPGELTQYKGGITHGLASQRTSLEPVTAKWSPEQSIDIVGIPELDYASDDIVIFHGYFGLFVYDLNSLQIIRSLDLKPLNCTAIQGDDYCDVTVGADGNTVQLHRMSSENMYVYTVSDNTLRETAYEPMNDRFGSNFVPIEDVVDSEHLGNYSYNAVKFDTGEYGYLYISDWTLVTLSYVRGDMIYKLFDTKEAEAIAKVIKEHPEFPDRAGLKEVIEEIGGPKGNKTSVFYETKIEKKAESLYTVTLTRTWGIKVGGKTPVSYWKYDVTPEKVILVEEDRTGEKLVGIIK